MRRWIAFFLAFTMASSLNAATTRNSRIKPAPVAIAPHIDREQEWSILLPTEDKVVFHGVVSYDHAGGNTNAMLYPAPNAAGFLAALITHGVLSQSIKAREKTKIQKQADGVLAPYDEILQSLVYKDLFVSAFTDVERFKAPRVVQPGTPIGTQWVVESLPAYFMAQGADAIWIENIVAIYLANDKSKKPFTMTVKVLSRDQVGAERQAFWSGNDGEKLKKVSAQLLSESIEIVIDELSKAAEEGQDQFETIRYMEGTNERMERGRIIERRCDRIIFKTLRGWTMSVPPKHQARDDEDAEAASAVPMLSCAHDNVAISTATDAALSSSKN